MEHARETSREWAGRKVLAARAFVRAAATLIYPPRCESCHRPVGAPHALCGDCFAQLRFLNGSMCACCGHPFPYAVESGNRCGECLRSPPPYVMARAALHYDEHSRRFATRLKYGDQHHLAPLIAGWMIPAGRGLAEHSDAIVPVPLHWRRRLARRFNQSDLLAGRLGAAYGLPVEARLLVRARRTQPQVGLSKAERARNVQSAFRVPDAGKPRIKGRRILLIDDVWTSGATIEAATKALLKGGAESVRVLTFARRILTDSATQDWRDAA